MMRVPGHVFAARVRIGQALDRALARYSTLQALWFSKRPGDEELLRRITCARVALHEAIAASTRATARDTRWSLAMRRARRARRVA